MISEDNNKHMEKQQQIVKQQLISQYIKYRKLKKLTQEDLAGIMGVKRPNISRFESGQCNPTLDLLIKMAECMDLEIRVELVEKQGDYKNEEK